MAFIESDAMASPDTPSMAVKQQAYGPKSFTRVSGYWQYDLQKRALSLEGAGN